MLHLSILRGLYPKTAIIITDMLCTTERWTGISTVYVIDANYRI